MKKNRFGVYKCSQPRYIRSGSFYAAVPQAARTTSAFSIQNLALACKFAERLFNPRGARPCVPIFDEEGGAHAHAA